MRQLLCMVVALVLSAGLALAEFQPTTPSYGNTVQTRPNIFGGVDINQGNGQPTIHTRPNIFGGYDVDRGNGQPTVSCRPNIFGGVDCR